MISRRLNSVRRLFSIVPDFRSLYPDTREDFEYLRLNSKEKSKGVERRYTKNEIGFFFSKTRLKQTSTFKKKVVTAYSESVWKVPSKPGSTGCNPREN